MLLGAIKSVLAAQLGDHATVRHILFKQCNIEWIWGPVTSFQLDLAGIDSAGEGGGDIMELIVRDRAGRKTQQMLLDSFMQVIIAARRDPMGPHQQGPTNGTPPMGSHL